MREKSPGSEQAHRSHNQHCDGDVRYDEQKKRQDTDVLPGAACDQAEGQRGDCRCREGKALVAGRKYGRSYPT